jgi:Tfp pilus assembly protein PilO
MNLLSLIRKNFKEFPIVFISGALILIFIVLLMVRGPKSMELDIEQAELDRSWMQMQANIERSANLEDHIERTKQALEDVDRRLMDVEDVAINFEFFYALEASAGITIEEFNQGRVHEGDNLGMSVERLRHYKILPYTLKVSGDFDDVLSFIDSFDHQPYFIRLERLEMSRPSDAVDVEFLVAEITCHVLSRKS